MKEPKCYTIKVSGRRECLIEGTLEYLTNYFGYTLEIGHSCDSKISIRPKTIKSFLSNLQRSLDIKEAACYSRTYIELIT